MIVSCAPARVTLGGGGTDLPSYYSKYGGFLVSAAIDKYVFISVNRRFHGNIRLGYSQTELVDAVSQIKHPILREALKLVGISGAIEIFSMADIPASGGLGSSGSFTVALLNALHTYKKELYTQRQLAEEACHIEIELLKDPVGKQDQYIAAFGGVTCFTFEKNGDVVVEPLMISDELLYQLEHNLVFFYTGIERSAASILSEQDSKTNDDDKSVTDSLHKIKEIGLESKRLLEKGDLNGFGELLDIHWKMKKRLSKKISDPFIDECYELAKKKGAIGGKIMGAGGGGFFMFYTNGHRLELTEALKAKGLKPTWFGFDFQGVRTLVNVKSSR